MKQLGLSSEQVQSFTRKVMVVAESRHSDYDSMRPLLYAIDPIRGRFGGTLWVFVPVRGAATDKDAYEAYAVSVHEGSAEFGYTTHRRH